MLWKYLLTRKDNGSEVELWKLYKIDANRIIVVSVSAIQEFPWRCSWAKSKS